MTALLGTVRHKFHWGFDIRSRIRSEAPGPADWYLGMMAVKDIPHFDIYDNYVTRSEASAQQSGSSYDGAELLMRRMRASFRTARNKTARKWYEKYAERQI